MKKIAYCLLNYGVDRVEHLALRLFNNDYSNININNIENLNNKKTLYNQFKGEENDNYNNENDINEMEANKIRNKGNSGRSSLGNNFRFSASSHRNSLKPNEYY